MYIIPVLDHKLKISNSAGSVIRHALLGGLYFLFGVALGLFAGFFNNLNQLKLHLKIGDKGPAPGSLPR